MVTMQQQSSQQPKVVTLQDFIAELGRDDVATANLVGYFDVLIEMDLELKEQEIAEAKRQAQDKAFYQKTQLNEPSEKIGGFRV